MKTNATKIVLSIALCAFVGLAHAQTVPPGGETPAVTTPAVTTSARSVAPVEILFAKVDRTQQADGPRNTFVVTGPAGLAFKKANITRESANNFTAFLTVDDYDPKIMDSLVIRIGDKVWVPDGFGGDKDKYWSLELRDVDSATAEILNGGPLAEAPKSSFKIEYSPYQAAYAVDGPVQVELAVINVGEVPLTIYWGTHGGGNYRCRDTQLAFTATLDGEPVPANSKPLPPGFISSPFVSKPNNALRRGIDLSEWLQFSRVGEYLIDATYTLDIYNPDKTASPSHWKVDYHDQFAVRIEKANRTSDRIGNAPLTLPNPAKAPD